MEWDGFEFPSELDDPLIFYTLGNVDVEHPVVRRALASTLQRNGITDTLNDGFKLIDKARVVHGQATYVGEDRFYTFYDPDNVYEDTVDPLQSTWVEFELGDYE